MNFWKSILPDDKKIVLWGIGEYGIYWARFMRHANRDFVLFDKSKRGRILIDETEYEIETPHSVDNPDEYLCFIIPFNKMDEIFDEAKRLGYSNIVFGQSLISLPNSPNWGEEFIGFPYGHFYSPFPAISDVSNKYDEIRENEKSGIDFDGIDLNVDEQLSLLQRFNYLFPSKPNWMNYASKESSKYRYLIGNQAFGLTDAFILYAMLREKKPSRIIEIGSGYSSAVTLDTNEFYLDNSINITFVEPYPVNLNKILKKNDRQQCIIIEDMVQNVPLDTFEMLSEGDILFVDSSHVGKFGSDVIYIFYHILPRLKSGVIVHFHDIFYPWAYPKEWMLQGWCWNEVYLLRSFLQYNSQWKILYFSQYLAKEYNKAFIPEWIEQGDLNDGTGSFWMIKK